MLQNTIIHYLFQGRQLQGQFEISKGVIRIRRSKNRQHNGQMKKGQRTNSDLRNTTQKTNDRATQTPLNIGGELRCSGMESSSCPTCGNRRVTLVTSDKS